MKFLRVSMMVAVAAATSVFAGEVTRFQCFVLSERPCHEVEEPKMFMGFPAFLENRIQNRWTHAEETAKPTTNKRGARAFSAEGSYMDVFFSHAQRNGIKNLDSRDAKICVREYILSDDAFLSDVYRSMHGFPDANEAVVDLRRVLSEQAISSQPKPMMRQRQDFRDRFRVFSRLEISREKVFNALKKGKISWPRVLEDQSQIGITINEEHETIAIEIRGEQVDLFGPRNYRILKRVASLKDWKNLGEFLAQIYLENPSPELSEASKDWIFYPYLKQAHKACQKDVSIAFGTDLKEAVDALFEPLALVHILYYENYAYQWGTSYPAQTTVVSTEVWEPFEVQEKTVPSGG